MLYTAIYTVVLYKGQRSNKCRKDVKEIANLLRLLKILIALYIFYSFQVEMKKKKCLLRGYILVRNMASIPPKKKDRVCKYMESGL